MSGDQRDGRPGVPPTPDPATAAALRRVADRAESAIAACDGVAITLVRHGKPTGLLCSSEAVREVDSVQYAGNAGPCLAAIEQLQVFRVDYLPGAQSWPEFARAAEEQGMLSSLSVPLITGSEVRGALNLYSRARDGFRGSEHAGIALAVEAETALRSGSAEDIET